METPKNSAKRIRPKIYVPTPKMSDRKKALFGSKSLEKTPAKSDSKDEDDDLGIMSPLHFSSSPSRYDSDDDGLRTFSDVLSRKSTPHQSVRKLFKNKYSDTTKYELISHSNKNLSDVEEISDDENEPATPKRLVDWENTWVNVSNANDLSAPIILLTPSETVQKVPKLSFRKSLMEEAIDRTPHDEEPGAKKRHIEEEKDSKARTSLSFTENSISTKKFYSTTPSSDEKTFAQGSSVLAAIRKNTGLTMKPTHHKTRHNTVRRSTKRTDINRGVFHKIQKMKPKKNLSIKKMTQTQLLHAAMNIIDNSPLNAMLEQNKENSDHQKKRMQNLLKNMKNPIEMARPLNIESKLLSTSKVSDKETNETDEGVPIYQAIMQNSLPVMDEENKNRKFFKSKTEKKAMFEVVNGVGATIDQGKISLDKPKPKKRKLYSLFDEDFDFQEEQQEVNGILSKFDSSTTDEASPLKERNQNTSPTMHISTLTTKFAELNPISNVTALDTTADQTQELHTTAVQEAQKLYPVFYKEKTNDAEPNSKRIRSNEWRAIDDNQLQIDAGQKQFGATECTTCGFTYTQHVPEDEMLHQQFHNSYQGLVFKGWEKENKVFDILEYGVSGRIIAITPLDTKPKLTRVEEIIKLVDLELGFANIPLHPRAIIYMAFNDKEIMGLCIAQPLQEAYKMISDFGIDFCSSDSYPVKCGISRIWVNNKYRRQGVGKKLFEAVKCHFVYGYRLSADEIAFSAPTEMGKLFASGVTGKNDFYVYQ